MPPDLSPKPDLWPIFSLQAEGFGGDLAQTMLPHPLFTVPYWPAHQVNKCKVDSGTLSSYLKSSKAVSGRGRLPNAWKCRAFHNVLYAAVEHILVS